MRNVLLSIVGLVIGIILITTLMPGAVNEAITDTYSENFNVSTGAGETSAIETLSYEHYYGDLTDLSASSTNGEDTPAILGYNENTHSVTVGGLKASDSRILTINYVREAHQEFSGFAGFIRVLPFLALVGLVIASLWGLFSHFSSARG